MEFDNSLLRTARALLAAARENPVLGTNTPPEIVLRLTRIDPDATDECGNDPRIARTIESLRNMGLSIHLGERGPIKQLVDSTPVLPAPPALIPTHQINLDLSVLVALVSDLTHAPLPTSVDAAHERFIPSAAYMEWKRSRLRVKSGGGHNDSTNAFKEETDDPFDSTQHSRALAEQLQQEMHKGIFQEIHERLLSLRGQLSRDGPTSDSVLNPEGVPPHVEFWTTPAARDRFLRIVGKVGGPAEKRRASALFPSLSVDGGSSGLDLSSLAEQEAQYWADSRYPRSSLPLLPIRVFSTPEPAPTSNSLPSRAGFFSALETTCHALLMADDAPHPGALEPAVAGDIHRAPVVRTNVRLTTHTVQSMLCGAARGWTTLTANRASVKVMLREVKMRGYGVDMRRGPDVGAENHATAAALWVIDPRSLAEGMRSDFVGSAPV
jgi:hypothetical protein